MTALAIATSCCGYGKYLGEWAASIAAQTVKPAEVAVVAHGCGEDVKYLHEVRETLDAAGIPARIDVTPLRLDFGEARNRAVRMTSAPWCMHADCDDVLLPWAVEDWARLAPAADVVSFGYERFGDTASGPANPRRLYRTLTGPEALASVAPCSGLSPFRRTFFDAQPYRLGMAGAWDTALWIGFAKAGARFRPTTRPAFRYRQHADSIFNRRRLTFDLTHYLVVHELHGLRHDWAGVTVAIPYRADGGPRDRALEYVRAWWAHHFPEWEVKVGTLPAGVPWSKHAATTEALRTAHGRTLIVADADCLVDPLALLASVVAVERGAPWAIPHGDVHRLTEAETAAWVADGVDRPVRPPSGTGVTIRTPYRGYAGGGFIVVRRDRWQAVGGFPVEFTGWGCEDEAVAEVLTTCLGDPVRSDAPLVHLWHPKGDRMHSAGYRRNRQRLNDYRAVRGDPDRMFELVNPRTRARPCATCPPETASALRVPGKTGAHGSLTRAMTLEIRRVQAERNAESRRLNDAALEAARARRLASRTTGAKPQR